ncbi:MAG: nitronate monooxygenase [Flavobacteriaceae bacterium]|jgi:enoyl-[acyl-carrier protein] reductase II|nr:nitronate monooxygenase [Flavobacteriaceae bacterium]
MNKIRKLFGIKLPIIQGGMVWNSGWQLVSAVSNNGGLGLLGSGSMYPEVLKEHIQKCKKATSMPFGVNLPLLYPDIDKHIQTIVDEKVPIVFTSAGNPKTYTSELKKHGIIVVHVVSSLKFALKSQEAGVDAVVAEGFEAGGHNGREETTTFCLIPNVKKHIKIPLIAAGGISTGQQILAAQILGADGVQIGSRFAATAESSAHQAFKEKIALIQEGDTVLTLKELAPTRLIKNPFFQELEQAYANGVSKEDLQNLLGKGRAKKGMFEGDLDEGELEIGQSSALIDSILTVKEVFDLLLKEYKEAKENMPVF